MTLQLHRPDGEGGLEPRAVVEPDWRVQLQSPRWGSALRGGRLSTLKNPEMNPTSRFRSVLFWLSLGILTFVLLVVGYGTGFWGSTPPPEPSPPPAHVSATALGHPLPATVRVRVT